MDKNTPTPTAVSRVVTEKSTEWWAVAYESGSIIAVFEFKTWAVEWKAKYAKTAKVVSYISPESLYESLSKALHEPDPTRLSAVEAQRDDLREALQKIYDGHYNNGNIGALLSDIQMADIAKELLAKYPTT